MSLAHKWLEQEPWPTKALPKKQLEERVERALTLANLGYLGTVRKDGSPSVSPVEYYAEFTDGAPTLYVFAQPRSPKVYAIQRDPRVTFAVAQPLAGWASVMGVQLFGRGRFIQPHTPEWQRGMLIYKWPASSFELGKITTTPPPGPLLLIEVDRIVYTEHYLRKQGYAPRQIWRRDVGDISVVPGGNSPI